MAWRIGVDIGGTFTDVALVEEETGRTGIFKVPTMPRDFAKAVVDGLRQGLALERSSTTAVCAYVGPLLAGYLERLQHVVSGLGLPQLHVMGSSGGLFEIAEALRMPAMAIESGPAAGVIAAALAGKELGLPNLISFDMGGTTAKASLIVNGEIAVTAEYESAARHIRSAGCTAPAIR